MVFRIGRAAALVLRKAFFRLPPWSGWDNLIAYVILFMLIPLAPIGFEAVVMGEVSEASLAITAAMYTIALGMASHNKSLMASGVGLCLCFTLLFGAVANADKARREIVDRVLEQQKRGNAAPVEGSDKLREHRFPSLTLWAWCGISLIGAAHLAERSKVYVIDKKPFIGE